MSLSELNRAEYEVLRATIRERGTARLVAVVVGVAAWASLAMALRLMIQSGAVTLVPLPFHGDGKAGRPPVKGNQFANR